jgi:hypothetical protein
MLKILQKKPNGFLICLLILLCSAPQVLAADFLLFYANDVQGETAPCG